VGIGNTNPLHRLVIGEQNGSTGEALHKGHIQIATGGGLTNTNGGLEFKTAGYTETQGYGWRITAPDTGDGTTPILFQSRANTNTWTERMRITNDGSVGIGTTVPRISGGLDIHNNLFRFGGNNGGGNSLRFQFSGSGAFTTNVNIDTGISVYANVPAGGGSGGGFICLHITTHTSSGINSGAYMYLIRQFYDNASTWTSNSTTVATIAALQQNQGTITFSQSANNTLQFSISTSGGYKWFAYYTAF